MAVILTCWILLLCINSIQSYNQLVIPGETQATASSLYAAPYFPNNTVDGNTRQHIIYCMHTKNERSITEAWLRINLLKVYSIKQVIFWNRDDHGGIFTRRLQGYSIRVSNDSDVPAETCYKDPGNVHLPTVLVNECVATSQYVWFYQTHTASGEHSPILEICEVQIFGCDTGRFGGNCTNICDHCKNPATCGIEQGECDALGCADSGFQSPMCVDCTQGIYGPGCSNHCSEFCKNDECDGKTGTCLHGCEDKWYGDKCVSPCGHCKNNDTCSQTSGICTHGCLDGYIGGKCDTACQDGKYGPGCKRDCGFCDRPSVCLHTNGSCPGNCITGYTGDRCVNQCTTGYYGAACQHQCGHCSGNDVCFHTNGSCPRNCSDGYIGEKCMDPCPHGTYGPHCQNKCGYCFATDVCSNKDGRCPGNCSDGFRGEKCSELCYHGWYGPACQNQCGNCFGIDVCFHTNGSCPGNCSDGFTGDTCLDACELGWYGPDCNVSCGNCNGFDVCFHTNGSCPGICSDGYTGDKCIATCRNGWYGSGCKIPCGHCLGSDVCHHINGSCPGNCTDGYTGKTCSDIVEQISFRHDKSQSSDLIAIPVAIILSVMAIVAIIIFLLRWKRRNMFRQKLEEENVYYLPDITKEDENEYEELNNIEETSLYNNQQFKSKSLQHSSSENRTKPIMIMDLLSTIHKLKKHSNIGFKKEFESISSDVSECSCKAGKLRINVPKNRYATTLPYDHSRVVLSSNRNDYINANIIKNARGEPAYIATQGPTSNTMCEFWRMVWQEKICVIAMTTYNGNGYEDINQYLLNSIARSVEKGNFLIQLMSDKTYSCFKIRHIQISCRETNEIRVIKHLEFTAWPKHSKPQPLELLLYYHYVSRSMEECPENKLLVHCSSGTGPTAVIIALDALYKQGMRSGMISISKFVGEMRKDRMEMIQNVEQYICLHYVLYESFRATSYVQSKDTLLTEDKLPKTNDEFNILSSIRPSEVCIENTQKNFKDSEYENMTSEEYFYRLDALDAVKQSSFTTRNIIITGRYPHQGEAVDLIRLLIDHKCTTLVSVNPLAEVLYSKEWLTQFGNVQNFQVGVMQGPNISEHIMLSTLRNKALSDVDWQQMTVYEITSWKFSEKVPADINAILDLIKFVQVDKQVEGKTKLVILSKDGATGCGVLCAVYNAIQQLQQDEEVDMFTIVRQLQSRRPEMISDLSEYLFCYQAVTQYIKGK